MHPILRRVASAYGPLAARNRLVEGHPLRSVRAPPPHRRTTLVALLGALFGRRP
jgi:hypothetical protein